MELTVNEKILTSICNDNNVEIIEYLNSVIDEELLKDNPDCDLIDECINTIYELENSDEYAPALRIALTSESIKKLVNPTRTSWKRLNLALRVAIVAAIIATSTFTVNAAVVAITGVNLIEKFTNTITEYFINDEDEGTLNKIVQVPATTKANSSYSTTGLETTHSSPTSAITGTTTKEVDNEALETGQKYKPINTTEKVTQPTDPYKKPTEKVEFTGIRAEFKDFKTAYIYGEELSYNGLTIYAEYSDNSEQVVPLSKCAYSKNLDMNKTTDYTLSVTYKGCTVKADITVRPDEATRFSDVCNNKEYDYLKTKKGAYITAYKGTSKSIVLDNVDGEKVYALTTKVFADSDIKSFSSNSIEIVYPSAFENCSSLINCNIPKATSIGDKAFKDCNSLTSFDLNDDLTKLGKSTFESSGITSLSIPSGITVIPDMLCNNCESLQNVTFNGKVTTIGQMAFNSCYELTLVKGTGYIKNVEHSAFCDNENMTFDVIPNLENIGASAFAKCESVEFGKIGSSFKSLGENAFDSCKGITEVVITKNIEVVPASCFDGIDLTKLTLENGVKRINMSAFRGFDITELIIPASVEYIGDYALYSTTLRNLTIESRNVEIADMAFYKSRRTTLSVYENSTAHRFAVDNELRFNLMEEV